MNAVDPNRLNLLGRAGMFTTVRDEPVDDAAAASGSSGVRASRRVYEDGAHRFDFYQLVRIVERVFADRSPVGVPGGRPQEEPIQFRQLLTLAAPTASVARLTPPVAALNPARLIAYVTLMGVAGPGGVLPRYFTQLAMSELNAAPTDSAARAPLADGLDPAVEQAGTAAPDFLPGPFGDLLDLFTHRLVSLHYRAWERSHPLVAYERAWWTARMSGAPEVAPKDEMSPAIAAFLGLGLPRSAARLELVEPAGSLTGTGAAAIRRPRPGWVVERLLQLEFDLPVRLVPLQGEVMAAAPESRWKLGGVNTAQRSVLRADARGGDGADRAWFARKEWHPQDRIILEAGPMSWTGFRRFVPADDADDPEIGADYRKMSRLARFLAGEHVGVRIRPALAGDDVPPARVGGEDRGIRLGWSTWLNGVAGRSSPPPLFPEHSGATSNVSGTPRTVS
jgi:type VI secretion system protein ImpH